MFELKNAKVNQPGEGERQCRKCRQVLSLRMFIRDKSRPDGHHPYCSTCRQEIQNNRRQKMMADLIEELGGKCTCCGSTYKLAIDHIDPKDKPKKSREMGRSERIRHYRALVKAKKAQVMCDPCNRNKSDGESCSCGGENFREHEEENHDAERSS